ncbi:hypothetical protein BZA70DRAFT_269908 [Myxozyma melibiosi]|uniref:Uncharacterized protein n=1 Tax=Myxozyma melibiosi TaxID=54550 RepID=A0ABR1EYK2_9ASCO
MSRRTPLARSRSLPELRNIATSPLAAAAAAAICTASALAPSGEGKRQRRHRSCHALISALKLDVLFTCIYSRTIQLCFEVQEWARRRRMRERERGAEQTARTQVQLKVPPPPPPPSVSTIPPTPTLVRNRRQFDSADTEDAPQHLPKIRLPSSSSSSAATPSTRGRRSYTLPALLRRVSSSFAGCSSFPSSLCGGSLSLHLKSSSSAGNNNTPRAVSGVCFCCATGC